MRRARGRDGDAALDALWAHHHADLRDPHEVVSQWAASDIDARLLRHHVRGRFWDVLEEAGGTLIVTREYEHLVVALSAREGRRRVSYLRLPHPSGVAVDVARQRVFVASTRNPNMVFELTPGRAMLARDGAAARAGVPRDALLPVACRYLPGCLYLHDLALIGSRLHGNAVALNAVVALGEDGGFRPVWWPRSIDGRRGPRLERNYLQLNSIAAGATLRDSFFSASAAEPSARRPGHLNFPVDGRGVIFSGRTREVIARGLTRPHSARLARGALWVANSGYGEVGRVEGGRLERLARLPGWTRGLCLTGGVAFAGTSRVIPRFRHYAPGIDPRRSETGVHAVEIATGRVLGSLVWPLGNQIFAVDLAGGLRTAGFPFTAGGAARGVERFFFTATAADLDRRLRR